MERRATLYALRAALPSVKLTLVDVMGPIQIVLTRRGPTAGLDLDNLQAAFKAVRDGVADWLQIDDGDPRLHWTYRQGRAASWAVVIEVQTPSDVTVLDVADELLGPTQKKTVARTV